MPTKRQRLNQLKGTWTVAEISVQFKPGVIYDYPTTTQEEAYPFILSLWDGELINLQEQMMALFFNGRNKIIGYRLLSTGSMESLVIDIRLLASLALHSMATFVIIAHNHPTGNLQPSINDIVSTKKIRKVSKLIDVTLIDHLIISETGWCSMRAEGLL